MVLKKKIGVLITLFVCLLSLIGLVSCGGSSEGNINSSNNNSNNSSNNNNNSTNTTLSSHEKGIVDILKIHLQSFNDPGSVTVKSVNKSYFNGAVIALTISAKNSLGGMVSNEYGIVTKDVNLDDYYDEDDTLMSGILSKGYFGTIGLENTTSSQVAVITKNLRDTTPPADKISYSISNINNALNEYKKSQGWS